MTDKISNLGKTEFYESVIHRIFIENAKKIEGLKKQIAVLKDRLPGWKENVLKLAQEAYDGMQILPGTGGELFFVGIPAKWKELPVTDKEYLWSINRMYHWNTFILAFYLTGDSKYVIRLKEELADWIRQCPPPSLTEDPAEAERLFSGVTPWRTLEVGIRMFEVWPNANHNHYLMENLGLRYLSDLFPELSDAKRWAEHANRQLGRCAYAQLTKDGAQIEGCPTYHNLCMQLFCLWLIASEKNGYQVPDEIRNMIRKGLDYSLESLRPWGSCVPWGDSDSDYSAVKAAAYGYHAFHDDIWLIGLQKLLSKERMEKEMTSFVLEWGGEPLGKVCSSENKKPSLSLMSFQKEIGQAAYRSSWNRDALHVHFGCRMPGKNGHAHIDPLAFDFSALGKPMVVDPGRFTYDEANDRQLFKSAKMHNMLLIDDREPYEYLSSWRFGEQHDGCLLKAEEQERYFWASGMHTCYFPIIHHRVISMIEGRFLLVWDFLSHMDNNDVNIYFNVDEEHLAEGSTPGSYHTENKEGKNVLLCPLFKSGSGTLPGYASDYVDIRRRSTRVWYEEKEVSDSAEYAVVMVPYAKKVPQVELKSAYKKDGSSCMEIQVDTVCYTVLWDGERFTLC